MKVLVCRLLQIIFFLLMVNGIILAILLPSPTMLGVLCVVLICGSAAIWGFQRFINEETFWKKEQQRIGEEADKYVKTQAKRGKRS